MSKEYFVRTQDLLTCFFSTCETAFRFLERKHGYSYYSGLASYAGGRQIIRPYTYEDMPAPFFAVTRYEKENAAIEILYGDNEFSLDIYFCPDRIHRFSMMEILQATKKSKKAAEREMHLHEIDLLEKKLKDMAALLFTHADILTDLSDSLIKKAAVGRAKKMEKRVREQFHKNLKISLAHAAGAFAGKNYKMVVSLLMPYERYLKRADLRKLEIARQSLIK